jgi:hypothetical protein
MTTMGIIGIGPDQQVRDCRGPNSSWAPPAPLLTKEAHS